MAEDTVPRPIRYRFLEQAQQVCDLAKVDYWEYSEMLSSLREQMETSYRAYDRAGLYKDEAEEKALEDFGSVEEVASVHRGGWRGLWHRLLFTQRYSVYRLIAPVLFCMLHLSMKTTGTLGITVLASGDLVWRIALFGWDFYVGVIVIAVIFASRWSVRYLRVPKAVAEITALILAFLLFGELVQEWFAAVANWFVISRIVDDVPRWKNMLAGSVYMVGYVIEAFTFLAVVTLSAAEILDIPACHRRVIEAKREGNLSKSGIWALSLTNCFKVLTGQWRGLVWKKVR